MPPRLIASPTLAYIRATVAGTLTDTCFIEREADTTDEYGAPTHTWAVVSTDVPCRLIKPGQFNTSAGELVGSQDALDELYKLVVARSVTLGLNYRVTVGEAPNSETFYVVRLEVELSDEAFHAVLMARTR